MTPSVTLPYNQWWDSDFLLAGSLTKVILFTLFGFNYNGTSLNGNADRFADQIKFRETVL